MNPVIDILDITQPSINHEGMFTVTFHMERSAFNPSLSQDDIVDELIQWARATIMRHAFKQVTRNMSKRYITRHKAEINTDLLNNTTIRIQASHEDHFTRHNAKPTKLSEFSKESIHWILKQFHYYSGDILQMIFTFEVHVKRVVSGKRNFEDAFPSYNKGVSTKGTTFNGYCLATAIKVAVDTECTQQRQPTFDETIKSFAIKYNLSEASPLTEVNNFLTRNQKWRFVFVTPFAEKPNHVVVGQLWKRTEAPAHSPQIDLYTRFFSLFNNHIQYVHSPKTYIQQWRPNNRICPDCLKFYTGDHNCKDEATITKKPAKICEECGKKSYPGHKCDFFFCQTCRKHVELSLHYSHRCIIQNNKQLIERTPPDIYVADFEAMLVLAKDTIDMQYAKIKGDGTFYTITKREAPTEHVTNLAIIADYKHPETLSKFSSISAFVNMLYQLSDGKHHLANGELIPNEEKGRPHNIFVYFHNASGKMIIFYQTFY